MQRFGTVIWVVAYLINISTLFLTTNDYLRIGLFVILIIHMPFQLYSWLKGVHRGQVEHFLHISLQFLYAIILANIENISVANVAIYSVIYVGLSLAIQLRLRTRFPNDFKLKKNRQ